MNLATITPIILTHNEAPNISRVLERLEWADRVVVVDSGSDDGTLDILAGSRQVQQFTREFDSHAAQWNFALNETGITTEWVLALDADYVLTDEFLSEIVQCEPDPKTTGYAVRFKLLIHGQALRSGLYPPVIVLYRARLGQYVQDGHTQRLRIEGTIGTCEGYILHDDRKALSRWLWAQERYSLLECDRLLEASWRSLSIKNKFRYSAVIMPWLVPLYCLFVRGGILDGWRGVFYALQRAIVEGLLAIRIIDARIAKRVPRKP